MRAQGPPDWPLDDPAVGEALQRSLKDRSWGKYHGPACDDLSRRLADYHGCEHAIVCASGTAAVELALRGLKVGDGDEVILAAYDFKGNFQDVLTVGATPVLVDLDPANWNLDPRQLEAAIGPGTKAMIVSHLHGGVVPMPAVMEIARRHGMPVVEDACQMPGATVYGKRAGTWGDVGVLSFGGSKLLTAGRGGALVTNDAEIVQRIRLYTQRGNEAYPLSELQAAVLVPQLERLDERNARRAENAARLCELLAERAGLVPFHNSPAAAPPPTKEGPRGVGSLPASVPPPAPPYQGGEQHGAVASLQPGYYKVGLKYDPECFAGLSRDGFVAAIQAEGIAIAPGFRALHRIHSRRRYRSAGELPVADVADESVLTLHHPILLGDADDMRQIVEAVDKIRTFATMIRER